MLYIIKMGLVGWVGFVKVGEGKIKTWWSAFV